MFGNKHAPLIHPPKVKHEVPYFIQARSSRSIIQHVLREGGDTEKEAFSLKEENAARIVFVCACRALFHALNSPIKGNLGDVVRASMQDQLASLLITPELEPYECSSVSKEYIRLTHESIKEALSLFTIDDIAVPGEITSNPWTWMLVKADLAQKAAESVSLKYAETAWLGKVVVYFWRSIFWPDSEWKWTSPLPSFDHAFITSAKAFFHYNAAAFKHTHEKRLKRTEHRFGTRQKLVHACVPLGINKLLRFKSCLPDCRMPFI